MAEAAGLGASVVTFITVVAQLSKAAATLHGSIKDAPNDVQRVQTRLKDLEFILTQIDRTRSMNPECVGDPSTENYWNGKEAKLRSDFAEFERFTTQLVTNIGKAKGKIKWFLSHEDRAKKVLDLLAEDINLLRVLLGIMESNTLGKIYRAQAPAIEALTRIGQIVDHVNATMVTKQQFADHHNALRLMLKPCTHAPHSLQSARSMVQDSDMLISRVVLSYANYYFTLGRISLTYGWRSREPDGYAADGESLLAGEWDFKPALWVSYHSMRIQARLLIQFGGYSKPRITPSLTVRVCVSKDHPVWECIKQGDLIGVQRHLSTGSIGVNDTALSGRTLLVEAQTCEELLYFSGDQPTHRARRLEILKLLIQSGAEGEAFCDFTIGSKKYTLYFQLRNDQSALRTPQSASPSAVDMILNAGAHFLIPECIRWNGFSLSPVGSGLNADYHDQYIDDLKEYLLDMLSRDLATVGWDDRQALAVLLTKICCGRSRELWDTWRQRHTLPADMGFSPGPLVDEILSILQPWPPKQESICRVLNEVFDTGDIDAGNGILSLFITRSPTFAAGLRSLFSWQAVRICPPVGFLGTNSDSTQELLERCGADPKCIMYYRMASVLEVSYWEEALERGIDDEVLSSLLLFSLGNCSAGFTKYLLARGASVNFRSKFTHDFGRGWTALAYAANRGDREMVMALLDNGADVLLEVSDYWATNPS